MLDMEILKEAYEERKNRKKADKEPREPRLDTKGALEEISRDPEKGEALEEIRKVLTTTPEVRQARVDEIKKQLDAGTFAMDSKRLAEKILQETILEELL